MGRLTILLEALVLLLFASSFVPQTVLADSTVKSESLVITAYLDGFSYVNQNLELNQSTLSVNITLLGETRQNLLVMDENSLPLDYSISGNTAVIFNIGSMRISVSYLTQDLTSKIGKYWTIRIDYPKNKVIILPQNASIISLSTVPDLIETSDGHITLTMPPGLIEVTYIAEHTLDNQTETFDQPSTFEIWPSLTILSLSLTIPLVIAGFWFLKIRKSTKPQPKTEQRLEEVDLDKLFNRHRELRQDEIQVIRYLAGKNGKAFEAELFELLSLPRTTTWRLIKRLQGMEIVDIKKSRRQNIVLIRDKYLKKPNKETNQRF